MVVVSFFYLHCPSLNAIFLFSNTVRRALVYFRGSRYIIIIIIIVITTIIIIIVDASSIN